MHKAISALVCASVAVVFVGCSDDFAANIHEYMQGSSRPGAGSGHSHGECPADAGGGGSQQSIVLKEGVYASGDYSGYLWTAHDSGGSNIDPVCDGSGACFDATACVSGIVAKVPEIDGNFDWAGTWGTMVGWNLAMSVDNGQSPPVALLNKRLVALRLVNMPIGLPVRVSLTVPDGAGGESIYCKNVTLQDGVGRVKLGDLRTECWGATGTAFDPESMQVRHLSIQFVSDSARSYPFQDVCVTELSIQ